MSKKKWYLGDLKDGHTPKRVYLYDFSWDCDWYWGGGYIGNNQLHTHFNSCFLEVPDSRGHSLGAFYDPWTKLPDYLKEEDVTRIRNGASVWENLSFFLDNAQYGEQAWWRLKDLFKQFYIYKDAAGAFHSGGHCTSHGRVEEEINPVMEAMMNEHIEKVIIPQVHDVLNFQSASYYEAERKARIAKGFEGLEDVRM